MSDNFDDRTTTNLPEAAYLFKPRKSGSQLSTVLHTFSWMPERDKSSLITPDLSRVSVESARERKGHTTMEYYDKMYNFSAVMQSYQVERDKLYAHQKEFEDRRLHCRQLIVDNLNKLRRLEEKCSEHIRWQRQAEADLQRINAEMEAMLLRKEFLLEKLNKLKVYEDLISKTVDLLPKDYVPSNTSRNEGLVSRFAVLCHMKELLLEELYQTQTTCEHEGLEAAEERQRISDEILAKNSMLQEIMKLWEVQSEGTQVTQEQYQREKDRIIDEYVYFVTTIRALRNIADKATSGLHSLRNIPVPDQHKNSLCANFRVIMRFLDVVMAIRDEINPRSRKLSVLSEKRTTANVTSRIPTKPSILTGKGRSKGNHAVEQQGEIVNHDNK